MIHDGAAKVLPAGKLAEKLKAEGAAKALEAAPPAVKLVTNIFLPHLERIPASCGRCGHLNWKIVLSPLLGEHKWSAVIQQIACAQCGAKVKVLDGMVHGRRPNAHKPPRRVK